MYLYLEEQPKNTAKIPDNFLNCSFHEASDTAAFQVVQPILRNWDGEYTRCSMTPIPSLQVPYNHNMPYRIHQEVALGANLNRHSQMTQRKKK